MSRHTPALLEEKSQQKTHSKTQENKPHLNLFSNYLFYGSPLILSIILDATFHPIVLYAAISIYDVYYLLLLENKFISNFLLPRTGGRSKLKDTTLELCKILSWSSLLFKTSSNIILMIKHSSPSKAMTLILPKCFIGLFSHTNSGRWSFFWFTVSRLLFPNIQAFYLNESLDPQLNLQLYRNCSNTPIHKAA